MINKRTKITETYNATNGLVFEYAPDERAALPFSKSELAKVEVVNNQHAGITTGFIAAFAEMRTVRGRGRPKAENPKKLISFRLDADIVEHLKRHAGKYNFRVEQLLCCAITEGRI